MEPIAQYVASTGPAINSARYDGTQIQAWWTPASDSNVTGYLLVAGSSDGGVQYQTSVSGVSTGYGSISVPLLNDNIAFTIQVQEVGGPGTSSPAVPLVTSLPPLQSVYYDGTNVYFSWTPVPAASGGYLLAMYPYGGGTMYTAAVSDPFASSGMIPTGPLNESQTWLAFVAVQGQGGVLAGAPGVGFPVPLPALTLNYASYRGGNSIIASWQPQQQGGSLATYVIEVTSPQDDTCYEIAVPSAGATSGVLSLPVPLNPWQDYELRVIGLNAAGLGVATPPYPIVSALPAMVDATYDGQSVELTWTPSANVAVTGYTLYVLSLSSGNLTTATVSGQTTATGSVPTGALDSTQQWVAYVAATYTASSPVSSMTAQLPLLAARPVLATLFYDGTSVTATWAPVLGAGVTSYTLSIQPPTGQPLQVMVTGELSSQATLAIPALLATSGCTATLTATAGASSAVSAALTLDTAPPPISTATYTDGAVTASWTPSTDQTVTGYLLAVSSTTSAQSFSTVVSGGSTGTGKVTVPLLGTGGGYVVTVATQRADGITSQSAPVALVTNLPELTSVAYDGSNVTATWGRIHDATAGVASLVLAVRQAGQSAPASSKPISDPTVRSGSVAAGALTGSYVTEIRAVSASGAVTVSPPIVIVIGAPVITLASFDGAVVSVAFDTSAVSGATGYRVSVTSGGSPVASMAVSGSSAMIPVGASAAPLVVSVAGVAPASTGPGATAVTLIQSAPLVTSATAAPASGQTTLAWNAVPSATGYLVQLFGNGVPFGQPLSATGTSYTIQQPLGAQSVWTATVTATVSGGSVALTGPASAPFTLMTAQPAVLGVTFDGTSASVTWAPAIGAAGYTVTILQNGTTSVGQTTVAAPAMSASVTPTIADPTQTYTAVVQALSGPNSGPPTAAVNIFTPGYFLSTQPAGTAAPNVFMGAGLSLAAATLTVYLPSVGALQNLPFTQGAFTLQANPDSTTSATYPYQLVIPASSEAWTFSPQSIRTQLQTDYVSFLRQAESNGAVPWGVSLIQQIVARVMPQTFAETLYYAYGLDLVNGCADLRPGMVLRVAMSNYVNLGTSTASPWLNGYAGGAVLDYEVSSYTGDEWLVGFDAFIAQLAASGVITVPPPDVNVPQMSGVAEAADLFYTLFPAPFYRLFFPATLLTPTGLGTTIAASNFVIASAPSYTALTATTNTPTSSNSLLAFFRGRAVLKLCIRVIVNGVEVIVPVGTSVGNLLDRYGRRPPGAPVSLQGVTLTRSLGPAVLDATAPYVVGQSYQVRFDWKTMPVYGPGIDATSLPLLHGDVLTTC